MITIWNPATGEKRSWPVDVAIPNGFVPFIGVEVLGEKPITIWPWLVLILVLTLIMIAVSES